MTKWTDDQKLAIESSGKNIIVSAGAGSGKTAVLSERVLTHVKNGIGIDELLILTFTNAAAMEMKNRIRKKLVSFGFSDEADKVSVADITTFDAFSLSLVKKYNHLLNISDKVSIIDSGQLEIKKEEFLTDIFEKLYREEDKLFLKLIDDFCVKDDKEIFKAILDIDSKLNNLYDKEGYLSNYVDNYYSSISKYVLEYVDFILSKINDIKVRLNYLESYVSFDDFSKINDVLSGLFNSQSYADIKRNLNISRFPSLTRGSCDEAKSIKKDISAIYKEIVGLCKYDDLNEITESIMATKDYACVIVSILLEFNKMVNAYKKEHNAYDFSDIAVMAINIVKNNADVREKLKKKYKEILIDEYQDTNDIQDMFISLISNDNIYMVGDIKQSIYRFRNANPLIFKSKYDNYSNSDGGMKIDLNKNFRSRSEIAFSINKIFNLIMDDYIGGADYFSSHQMVYGNKSYDDVSCEDYSLEILNYSNDSDFSNLEVEMFCVARDIISKVQGGYKIMDKETMKERCVSYSDFVILVDRSSDFETYKKVFEYLNIPLMIYRDKTISDSTSIMLIRNLYRIVISIKDGNYDSLFKYAFMSILRSYLYRLPDNDIFNIITLDKFKDTDLFKKCEKLALDFDFVNNYDFYNKIIDRFDFYSKIISVGNVSEHLITLESIGKIASNLNDFGYSPRMFLSYLDEISNKGLDLTLSLNKESSNSVKIMTIHASKGLEYPICYYVGLDKKFNIDELKNKFYFSSKYGIVMPYVSGGIKNTVIKDLLKEDYKHEEISERLRLLYVALTRAREKMIIVCPIKDVLCFKENGVIDRATRDKYARFSDVISSIASYMSDFIVDVDFSSLNMSKDYNYVKKSTISSLSSSVKLDVHDYSFDYDLVESSRFSKNSHKLIDKSSRENMDFGLRMHSILEHIDFVNPDYSDLSSFEKQLVSNFLSLDIVKKGNRFYKEYEFIYDYLNEERHGIIDLLIECDDRFIIVDYKLNDITDDAYLKQLNGYKEYISMICLKPVDIYLYSLIKGKLVQIKE